LKAVEVRGPYSNIKDQVRALEELREKLPSLDAPEPSLIKCGRPRRARQLRADQVEQLIADYRSGATVYELGEPSRISTMPAAETESTASAR
jgi:hypothetical protein